MYLYIHMSMYPPLWMWHGGFSGGVFFFCAFAIEAMMGKRVVARLDEVIRR